MQTDIAPVMEARSPAVVSPYSSFLLHTLGHGGRGPGPPFGGEDQGADDAKECGEQLPHGVQRSAVERGDELEEVGGLIKVLLGGDEVVGGPGVVAVHVGDAVGVGSGGGGGDGGVASVGGVVCGDGGGLGGRGGTALGRALALLQTDERN